jgi:hypothetical protein
LILSPAFSKGQNCSVISATKDKKNGTETFSGMTHSKDFYTLLIRKKINHADKQAAAEYTILFVAASKVLLADSMLNTKGTIELTLLDNSIMKISKVTYTNNPIGQCCALGFHTIIEEDQIKILANNPIVTFKINEVQLTTSFAPKKQKQIQAICACLLSRYPN